MTARSDEARLSALAEMADIAARRALRADDEAKDYARLRALWNQWRRKIPTAAMADVSGVTVAAVRKQWGTR